LSLTRGTQPSSQTKPRDPNTQNTLSHPSSEISRGQSR
jgi:hypothetical protein